MNSGTPSGLEEFWEAQQGRKPGTAGWWERVLPELSEEQVDSLNQAAGNPTISHRTISVVLGRWGFEVSPAAVGHWRRNYASR